MRWNGPMVSYQWTQATGNHTLHYASAAQSLSFCFSWSARTGITCRSIPLLRSMGASWKAQKVRKGSFTRQHYWPQWHSTYVGCSSALVWSTPRTSSGARSPFSSWVQYLWSSACKLRSLSTQISQTIWRPSMRCSLSSFSTCYSASLTGSRTLSWATRSAIHSSSQS